MAAACLMGPGHVGRQGVGFSPAPRARPGRGDDDDIVQVTIYDTGLPATRAIPFIGSPGLLH
jgi:hypothetical protein